MRDKLNYHIIGLILITLFAMLLRFYMLEQIPRGLYVDEAAFGYDAYSILKTGKDMHGNFLPILMNAHNHGFNEAMYTYLTILPVSIFDVSIFSTRFIAAIIGTLTVLTTYLFVNELLNKKIGLLAALLVTVSPWHLQFSRIAFAGILVPFFTTLGLFFFLKGLQNTRWFIASALIFGLSLYTYPIMKAFVPLLLVVLFLLYFKELRTLARSHNTIKHLLFSTCVFLALAIPVYYLFIWGPGSLRFNYISVFATSEQPIKQFIINFSKHLSPDFLLIHGDSNLRHNIPNFGQILWILAPFILLTLLHTCIQKNKNTFSLFIFFLIGIIPSSLTNEAIPHALRSLSAVPFLEITAAFGAFLFFDHFKNRKLKITLVFLFALLLSLNILFYLHAYFIKYPSISEHSFHFGIKEAIQYAQENSNKYDQIILTHNVEQAFTTEAVHVLPLFFAKLDPVPFQNSRSMGKYDICETDMPECYKKDGHNLFITTPSELPDRPVLKYINNEKNETFYKIIES